MAVFSHFIHCQELFLYVELMQCMCLLNIQEYLSYLLHKWPFKSSLILAEILQLFVVLLCKLSDIAFLESLNIGIQPVSAETFFMTSHAGPIWFSFGWCSNMANWWPILIQGWGVVMQSDNGISTIGLTVYISLFRNMVYLYLWHPRTPGVWMRTSCILGKSEPPTVSRLVGMSLFENQIPAVPVSSSIFPLLTWFLDLYKAHYLKQLFSLPSHPIFVLNPCLPGGRFCKVQIFFFFKSTVVQILKGKKH